MKNKKKLTTKEEFDFWQKRIKTKKPLSSKEEIKYRDFNSRRMNEKKQEVSILLNKGKKKINKVVVEKKEGLIKRFLSIFKRK